MTADVPDLTIAELEQLREATLRAYEGGDEQYATLPPHLLKVVEGDGGLINMIDLAIARTRVLNQLRIDIQQEYAAIHAKQQRDAAQISDLENLVHEYHKALMVTADEAASATISGVDCTIVPPGTIAKMRAENPGPTPEFREAIARARQRREDTNGRAD